MTECLAAYHGDVRTRAQYRMFREAKRELYGLYPDEPRKARAIIRYCLVRAGWAPRPKP